MPTEHNDHEATYQEVTQQIEEARAAYIAEWPHHCRSCGGWGAFTWRETHGYPGGPGEQLSEPCSDCTARYDTGPQQCARCGERGLDEDGTGPCTNCGWDYDDGIPQW